MIALVQAVYSLQITVRKNTEVFSRELEQAVVKIRLRLLITLKNTKTIKSTAPCGAVLNRNEG